MIGVDLELVPQSFTQSGVTWPERARQLVHAHNVLGTKGEPTVDCGFTYHPDSVGIEFATPPCESAGELMDAIGHAREWLHDELGFPVTFMPGDSLLCSELFDAVAVLDRHVLAQLMRFGCSPDYLEGEERVVPHHIKQSDVRELGGHLHIDTLIPPAQAASILAQALDGYHVPEGLRLNSWYRKPGLYRPKPYGLEYRSLGASWAGQARAVQEIFAVCDQLPR